MEKYMVPSFFGGETEVIKYELTDYDVGDIVKGVEGIEPQYLKCDKLEVRSKGKKNLICKHPYYPEKFYVDPNCVRKES